jgi:hypothetical protein
MYVRVKNDDLIVKTKFLPSTEKIWTQDTASGCKLIDGADNRFLHGQIAMMKAFQRDKG